ncbi:ATPase [Sulfurimicrobium lacus]|uniref:ATPase n=1 Tax=Sulfurimicrobium lacus TaxID=2715678 RepID=A0A6F8V8G0_9PROT|nr:cation-transporting P-type ATPase [Sulfurimicrobium lacus]BCB26123.1 ATPase [Sulfurimicrobium lacus]
MQTLLQKPWHHVPGEEAATLLESDAELGLSQAEASRRQERFGPNSLTPKPGRGPLLRFLLQFHQPLIYILLASAAITAALQEWVDSSVIFGVVLVNAVVGFIQESKAENAISALTRIISTNSMVWRDGRRLGIPSEQLVPGDMVLLAAGDKVPADLRLLKTRELTVDESMLTGESLPATKHTDVLDLDTLLADRANMAYAGALVTTGQGSGIVVAIGDATETGRISRLIAAVDVLSTPLTRKIERFSKILLYAILGLAAFTVALGLARGETAFDMFMAAVALAVGAIPEGLPAAVTVTLAIGVSRMARRRAIIRKLPAVETLGSTTVICSDKTGTLTQNQMTVQRIFAGGEAFAVSGVGYAPHGEITRDGTPAEIVGALRECLLAGLLCNDASLEHKQGAWQVGGDPTEGALIVAALKAGLNAQEEHARRMRRDAVPFEARHQYMATLHSDGTIYLKGAVEKVLERCVAMLGPQGQIIPLDTGAIELSAVGMAEQGLRVLALAYKTPEGLQDMLGHEHLAENMVFLGLQGMIDPPRPEAVSAIKACHRAGIAVKMITGDHAITASAIAHAIALNDGRPIAVLSGRELENIGDAELIRVACDTQVFARVEPEQKLRLVKALQAGGQVVAMTGDGVNDAPALKQADIGVAMGITGTEVAKEAAAMVLTDDNFASIEAAVEEGRGVFDNLTKFIVWTLPTNFGEGLVITAAIVLGTALPILPVQILWINMTTAVLLGLTLAFEPIEKGIMNRPPRPPSLPLLTPAIMWRIGIVSALLLAGSFGLFMWELKHGHSLAYARTVAANVFVFGEIFYLLNCRSMSESILTLGVFSNLWVVGGVSAMIALQLLFTYLPAMNHWFGSAPIDGWAWGRIIATSAMIYLTIGVEKRLRKAAI